jgi:heme-degrading monooxygenase HmoA
MKIPRTQHDTGPSRRNFIAGSLASGIALAVQPASAQNQKRSLEMEITIRANSEVTTLINVFAVEPEDQEKLIQLLEEGTETLFSKQPGYISASFHKSKDGRRVVNYGQWRSPKDIEAFRIKPEIGEYLKRVKSLAQFETIVCEASYVHRL